MGFFASLFGKKTASQFRTAPAARPAPAPVTAPTASNSGVFGEGGEISARPPSTHQDAPELDVPALLVEARERLDMKDLPAALHIYERLANAEMDLSAALTAISGDLGATGHIQALIEFVAPRYDPRAHGLTPGINLIQAFLHEKLPVPALQLIDFLKPFVTTYSMRDRLDGFRTAAEEIRASQPTEAAAKTPDGPNVQLINVSRPLWTYGLPQGENLLPTKNHRVRSLAILPLALNGDGVPEGRIAPADHPLAGLVRGLPFAIAEACWYAPAYRAIAVTGLDPEGNLLISPLAFGGEQVSQLFPKDQEPLDYALTGTMTAGPEGSVASIEFSIWDMRKTKLMKTFRTDGPDAWSKAWPLLLSYLEAAKPGSAPLAYALPVDPAAHAVVLDQLLHFFLAEKGVLPPKKLGPIEPRLTALAAYAESQPSVAVPRLTFFSALHHCQNLRIPLPPEIAALADRMSGS